MNPKSISRLLLSAALLLAFAPRPLGAQSPDGRVGAWVGPSLLVSRVSSQASALAGVEAGLIFSRSFRLGGAGYTMAGEVELSRRGTTPLDLSLGYGGIVAHYLPAERGGWSLGAGLLAGAGTATVRDPVAGAELGSDNFAILEPRLEAAHIVRPFLELALSVRYRLSLGVNDLPGVDGSDIRGFGAAISLSLGSFGEP